MKRPGSGGGALAHLVAGKAPDDDFIGQQFGDAAQVLLDGDFGVALDKALVEQAAALKKLLQFAFDNFGDGLGRLVLDLFGGDFPFLGQRGGGDFFAGNDRGMPGRDLEGDVAHQLLEIFLADGAFPGGADLDQHAHLAPV